jgi:hypothetical protein
MPTSLIIKNIKSFISTLGIILFVLLYIIATLYYPGGSYVDKKSSGFSWQNNYWCNLLNSKAINGETNTAQPIALFAMLVLCFTLTYFWLRFPKFTMLNKVFKIAIQVFGTLAMTGGLLLFTNIDHDLITNLTSFFGIIATAGTVSGLYKNGWTTLFYFGGLNILLVLANNFLYYNNELILYLPLVQKITFVTFLIWFCCIDFRIFILTKNAA